MGALKPTSKPLAKAKGGKAKWGGGVGGQPNAFFGGAGA